MASRSATSPNALLYAAGRQYARMRSRSRRPRSVASEILDTIGHKLGESRAEVRTAIDFFEAVETLAKEAGPASKSLLLGGRNPYLTPALILELAHRPAGSQRRTMAQAALGIHPFARSVPVGTSPELVVWDHHFDQLSRAGALLRDAEATMSLTRLGKSELIEIYRDATAIAVAAASLALGAPISRLRRRYARDQRDILEARSTSHLRRHGGRQCPQVGRECHPRFAAGVPILSASAVRLGTVGDGDRHNTNVGSNTHCGYAAVAAPSSQNGNRFGRAEWTKSRRQYVRRRHAIGGIGSSEDRPPRDILAASGILSLRRQRIWRRRRRCPHKPPPIRRRPQTVEH